MQSKAVQVSRSTLLASSFYSMGRSAPRDTFQAQPQFLEVFPPYGTMSVQPQTTVVFPIKSDRIKQYSLNAIPFSFRSNSKHCYYVAFAVTTEMRSPPLLASTFFNVSNPSTSFPIHTSFSSCPQVPSSI
jgi:hypothetical protein